MTLPNFIIVGAQKSGTTTLYDILAQHNDIYLSSTKESKFFVDEEKYNRGIEFYSNEYFSNYNGEKAIGEIDPEYIFFEDVPQRLRYDISSNLKLIFILRNPVARAYSHYLMTYKRGWDELSFEEAIKEEPQRIQKDFFSKHHQSYITRGYYSKQIKRYLEYFPILSGSQFYTAKINSNFVGNGPHPNAIFQLKIHPYSQTGVSYTISMDRIK